MIRVSENDQGQRRISARIIRVRDAFPDATRGKHSSLPGNASLTLIILIAARKCVPDPDHSRAA
jgi:hypothetical protein